MLIKFNNKIILNLFQTIITNKSQMTKNYKMMQIVQNSKKVKMIKKIILIMNLEGQLIFC